MGYLFLGISLLAGATKGYCGKKTSGYVESTSGAMMANLIRMILCIFIGLALIIVQNDQKMLIPNRTLLLISAVSGIETSVFVVSWLLSVRKGAYMMMDVFLMLGVIVPVCGGNIAFGENIRITQWIGIAVLVVAAFIMCSYNNSIKEKMTLSGFLLLLLCGAANGITDFMQKLFVKQLPQTSASIFNFYTYVFSAIFLLICFLYCRRNEKNAEDAKQIKKIAGYISIMSICLFANSLFKTRAAAYLDSVQLYPLSQGLALTISTMMSAVFFHEKLTIKCIIGVVIAFAGLIIINVL